MNQPVLKFFMELLQWLLFTQEKVSLSCLELRSFFLAYGGDVEVELLQLVQLRLVLDYLHIREDLGQFVLDQGTHGDEILLTKVILLRNGRTCIYCAFRSLGTASRAG